MDVDESEQRQRQMKVEVEVGVTVEEEVAAVVPASKDDGDSLCGTNAVRVSNGIEH